MINDVFIAAAIVVSMCVITGILLAVSQKRKDN